MVADDVDAREQGRSVRDSAAGIILKKEHEEFVRVEKFRL